MRALDVFRGLTVAAMLLVNCSGSDEVYRQLDHAPWHGLTFTDLVFPGFLFIVGVSAVLATAAQKARGSSSARIARRSLARAAGLFALGLLVNAVVFEEPGGMRWPGVLQRIALCYAGAAGFLLLDRAEAELAAIAAILIGYWLLLTRVPVPGHGAGALTPEGNLASWLDRRLLGRHMLTRLEDQEGILSTLPAFATTLLGVAAGRRVARDGDGAAAALGAAGVLLSAFGFLWGRSFPLNKHLWTSSFALATGGLCLAGLSACLFAFRGEPRKWSAPLESLGRHSLAAYIGSGFVYGVLEFAKARLPDGTPGNLKLWLNARLFGWWLAPRDASLAFASSFVVLAAAASLLVDRLRARNGTA